MHPADRVTGACPPVREKVYRAFNGRTDANHFYGVPPGIAVSGFTYEGYGPGAFPTVFCAPLL